MITHANILEAQEAAKLYAIKKLAKHYDIHVTSVPSLTQNNYKARMSFIELMDEFLNKEMIK